MRTRQLGNPITKARAAGRAAGLDGLKANDNPYRRKPQHNAWEKARQEAAQRRKDLDEVGAFLGI